MRANVLGVSFCIGAGYALFLMFFTRRNYCALHTSRWRARSIASWCRPSAGRSATTSFTAWFPVEVGGNLVDTS